MRTLPLFLLTALAAQDFSNVQTEKAFAGYRFTEGPSWSPDKFLVYTDTPSNHILKWVPGGKPEIFKGEIAGPSGTAFDNQGRIYICEGRGRQVIRIDKKGNTEVLASKFEGKRLNAPNDIVVRKDGNVWFTDPAFGYQSDTRELDFYGIFHISPKGELDVVARLKTRPNGVTLAPGGTTLYVTDSDQHSILAFDLDKRGAASNQRTLISKIDGVPDGLRCDEKGHIYVAAHHVFVYTTAGRILHTFEFSEKPSNVSFGDFDYQTLYITARTSVYRVHLDVKGAQSY